MEELLALRGEAPEFQLSAFGPRKHFVPALGYVDYTPEERVGFVDELTEKTKRIFELGKSVSRAFIEIGYLLREIVDKNLLQFASIKSQVFADVYDFAFMIFGFQKSTTYNLISIVREFGDGEGGLAFAYKDYSYSQLVCLLPFASYERKMFTPVATVAEIKELRAGLKKYPLHDWCSSDFGKTITWRSELERVRKAAAEEAVAKKKDRKQERTQGLLEMLSSVERTESESSASPQVAAADVPTEEVIEVVSDAPKEKNVELRKKLELKNREERKKWVESVFDGASPYWTISELDLKIYRYVFVNGAKLFRFNGVTYWEAWSTEQVREDTVAKYFITDSMCPKFDMCRARSVNQVVDWLTEHGKEI